MPQDRYQTVQEVAERLAVAEATVRQWIKSGALRAQLGQICPNPGQSADTKPTLSAS